MSQAAGGVAQGRGGSQTIGLIEFPQWESRHLTSGGPGRQQGGNQTAATREAALL